MTEWIESATSARIAKIKPRAGGGASRDGCEIRLAFADGRSLDCYLSHDTRRAGNPERLAYFRREVSLLRALRESGVLAPHVVASDEARRAILTEMVEGETRFDVVTGEAAREALALDFLRELIKLHRLDPRGMKLDGFPDYAPPSVYARAEIADWKKKHRERGPEDPILVYALDWLEKNVPRYDGPSVIVHGDAGPANFLHKDGKVTVLLDWEMTHFGDPMEDFAWMSIRDLFQPFVSLKTLLGAYQKESGFTADPVRVRFYRIYNLMSLRVESHAGRKISAGVLGNLLSYSTLHLRVLVEELAAAAHVALRPVPLPDAPPGPNAHTYAIALEDLRANIVPRITDEVAVHRAKGLARVIKYWEAIERFGVAYDTMELDEIGRALGQRPPSIADARAQLLSAWRSGRLEPATTLNLFHARLTRETALLAGSMGALAQRHFQTLD